MGIITHARYINCFVQTVSDSISGKKRVYTVKRPGFGTSNTPAAGQKGYAKGSRVQAEMVATHKKPDGRITGSYGQSVLSPEFNQRLAAKGVTAQETPMQFLGAYTSRLMRCGRLE